MSEEPSPKAITVYPPQGAPLTFEGDDCLGLAIDPNLGLLVIKVRDKNGDELTFSGLPFSMRNGTSRIAPAGRLVVPR